MIPAEKFNSLFKDRWYAEKKGKVWHLYGVINPKTKVLAYTYPEVKGHPDLVPSCFIYKASK